MSISILHAERSPCGSIGSRTLYHLSLDRALSQICRDEKQRKSFLKVLSAPLLSPDDICQRQAVIRDFLKLDGLFAEFHGLISRMDALREKQKAEHHDTTKSLADPTLAHVDQLRNLIQANALTLKRTLLFLKAISELLEKHLISSSLLQALLAETKRITTSDGFSKALELCAKFEHIGTGRLDTRMELDCNGRLVGTHLLSMVNLSAQADSRQKGLFRRKKEEDASVLLNFPRGDECDKWMKLQPLSELCSLLDAFSSQLFERFGKLCDEITFYQVAMQYCRVLREKQAPLTFPTVTVHQTFSCHRLYDLLLLCNTQKIIQVIPYTVSCNAPSDGIAVFGANGSGKTVFLRTVGTAQLLAQAGLPLPAEAAEIGICTALLTQFSEAEKEFEAGNDAGRFEQEVRELAQMVDTVPKGGLVLLNETFQTTAYSEGAEGLLHILQWFSLHGIRYALVSHLPELEHLLASESVTVMHAQPQFCLVPKEIYE